MDDVQVVANDLARWLATRAGVTAVQVLVMASRAPSRSRLHLPRPRQATPSFEIKCAYKKHHRHFRYFIEQFDDLKTVEDILLVHTTGELMVQIPGEFGGLQPNDIFYGNRSVAAAMLGSQAPH